MGPEFGFLLGPGMRHHQDFISGCDDLPDADRLVLEAELARTGLADQDFVCEEHEECYVPEGPAFLVYYRVQGARYLYFATLGPRRSLT